MSVAIDLSQLPVPTVVEAIDYEVILAELMADLQQRYPAFDVPAESDPIYKILEVAAYRELLVRQRVNEAARAVMLAYAAKKDLDNLGALFNVKRLQTHPGDPDAIPPAPPTYEEDPDFRRRILLSLQGLSTAGPEGAYIYHALSASGQVLDASATSQQPGEVVVTVLSREGNGTANQALLTTVDQAVSAEEVRPLTDFVTVQSAEILPYTIQATLFFYPGPDSQVVLAEAQQMAQRYANEQHRLGKDITLSGLYAALHRPGVQRVEMASPTASITVNRQQAAYCTQLQLTDGGIDE
ncbi:baseplate J/gp47 family protein [Halomonas sp. CnH100-B]|uniref:baseplate assembly protein n=1 Tax=Halomonas sp. CnH100-B TaxID=2954490 RepID=UPI00209866AC|nr:baseplate J/gp47 family protein [Halomonas sp. CnH100-B]MCO7228748.1 baseplate J/gp47 family protein [Halomonas sp. CnH100-B]